MEPAVSQSEQPTARLLLRVLRRFEHALQERLHQDGFDDVTVAQTNVLRHLDSGGMRQSELAHDAGISKQAASQAVRALQQRDLVAVQRDPSDARARRVVYTERGQALIASAISHIRELEAEWEAELGEAEYERLRELLRRLG